MKATLAVRPKWFGCRNTLKRAQAEIAIFAETPQQKLAAYRP
jgi:hypothetical protein